MFLFLLVCGNGGGGGGGVRKKVTECARWKIVSGIALYIKTHTSADTSNK